MQYREFGKLGFKVSTFGLGCMRFPLKKLEGGKTEYGQIDEMKAIDLVRCAIDHGVNYIDTAYTYHEGNSEKLLAKALKDGYRERVKIATKCPVWLVEKYEDFERLLDEQLKKLEADYIDFYLLHSLSESSWEKVEKLGALDFLDKAVASGKIRYPGFSFHDRIDVFKKIIDSYDWKMCQVQYNILDEHYQAGIEGIKYAASKGIPVVIMEPLRGGSLVNGIAADVKAIWDKADIKRSPVDWCFRWICNHPEVTVVLSGVSTIEQLKEDIEIFETALPNSLTEKELAIIREVQECYKRKIKVGCTGCRYCMPCPSGVQINSTFELYDNAMLFDMLEMNRERYRKEFIEKGKAADLCVECGNCESACPQHISIIEKLKEAHAVLSQS